MCEQCSARTVTYGLPLPDIALVRATRDGLEMKAGQWGVVTCNDHALTIEFDDHTRDVLLATWKAVRESNDTEPGDSDADLTDRFKAEGSTLMLTVKEACLLWLTLAVLSDKDSFSPDAVEGSSEWGFGRLADHGPTRALRLQLRDYAPQHFNPFTH